MKTGCKSRLQRPTRIDKVLHENRTQNINCADSFLEKSRNLIVIEL